MKWILRWFKILEGLTVEDVIAISGHRVYPDRAALYRGLDGLKAREYILGGARGIDSDALEYLSRTQPKSIRTVVVPNRAIDQPHYARQITSRNATRVIELKNTGTDRFMVRNRFMVDRAKHLRAFYDFRGHGGTYNTIQYARSKGVPVSISHMIETDVSKLHNLSEREFRNWIGSVRSSGTHLSAAKGIIMGFFQKNKGYIPADVVNIFSNW